MNIKGKKAPFTPITIDKFLVKHLKANPEWDAASLKKDLSYFKKLKTDGALCDCGNSIWIIGSAFSGKGCFTCITGEADISDDYEIV